MIVKVMFEVDTNSKVAALMAINRLFASLSLPDIIKSISIALTE